MKLNMFELTAYSAQWTNITIFCNNEHVMITEWEE